ncbi:hypothetical protein [Gallaecimonas mangrovi]|uniref:hypothetical protein n=1 Tax=Gallaecimonas mangrovi TaxID=2291597 RepID=UPI000E20285E|nr:hypothetical protein [Gallaecimonas mangrovi]
MNPFGRAKYLPKALLLAAVCSLSACHDDNSSSSDSSSTTTATYTIGGTVSGLDGTVVLENNSGDDLTLTSDGSFTFATAVDDNSSYSVTVLTQPSGQACTVTNGSGTLDATNVSDVAVSCLDSAPTASLSYGFKAFDFSWNQIANASYYQLYENADGNSGFTLIADNITDTSYNVTDVSLYNKLNAQYYVAACTSDDECTDSNTVTVSDTLSEAVGNITGDDAAAADGFGAGVALSRDGSTLAVGVPDKAGNDVTQSGAIYIFTKSDGSWSQQQELTASDATEEAELGVRLALSDDGNTLVAGADGANDDDGEAYIFTRTNGTWSQQQSLTTASSDGDSFGLGVAVSGDGSVVAIGGVGLANVYIYSGDNWEDVTTVTGSDTLTTDGFGEGVALSEDGTTLAVGAPLKAVYSVAGDKYTSSSTGVDNYAGAVYVFSYSSGSWSQTAHLKPIDPSAPGGLGVSLSMSTDGNTLVAGAPLDGGDANSTADDPNTNASFAGAVYVFSNSASGWGRSAYLKAANAEAGDYFGMSVALSSDGSSLAAGAIYEAGDSAGVNGSDNNNASQAGAAYLFTAADSSWSQQAYLKASNPTAGVEFGYGIALSGDSTTLAVGAPFAYSSSSDSAISHGVTATDGVQSGMVYLY